MTSTSLKDNGGTCPALCARVAKVQGAAAPGIVTKRCANEATKVRCFSSFGSGAASSAIPSQDPTGSELGAAALDGRYGANEGPR
jgi:hypothetical protein